MKTLKNYKGYALYILLPCVLCVLCVGCNENKELNKDKQWLSSVYAFYKDGEWLTDSIIETRSHMKNKNICFVGDTLTLKCEPENVFGHIGFGETRMIECKTGENNVAIGYHGGFENEVKLQPYQLEFIEKCKKEGNLGCMLTINNQQTYVSFYSFNPSVGNAR